MKHNVAPNANPNIGIPVQNNPPMQGYAQPVYGIPQMAHVPPAGPAQVNIVVDNNPAMAPPMAAPPVMYSQPPGGFAPPPGGFGAPPGGYGAPPAGYGAPPAGYGAPPEAKAPDFNKAEVL